MQNKKKRWRMSAVSDRVETHCWNAFWDVWRMRTMKPSAGITSRDRSGMFDVICKILRMSSSVLEKEGVDKPKISASERSPN